MSSLNLASSMNFLIKVEYYSHYVICMLLLLLLQYDGVWIALLFNLPLVIYDFRRMFLLKTHLLDPTEIYSQVQQRKIEAIVRIAYFAILFILYLILFIKSILQYEFQKH